ncbi:DUF6153 family protein [Streptomyces sp. B6B3]|uniref:DUF6153 family protein n=1 Tax=Streptomyces sp. B6B3 TaxID=3153570 RepID=UPI00325CDFBB
MPRRRTPVTAFSVERRDAWGRGWLLLVLLGVLAGLVAMHGLTPGTAASAPLPLTGEAHEAAPEAADAERDCDCDHAHSNGGAHAEHADATCAAGGVNSGPNSPLPPTAGSGSGPGDPDAAAHDGTHAARSGRAPPSLSELQLLRI